MNDNLKPFTIDAAPFKSVFNTVFVLNIVLSAATFFMIKYDVAIQYGIYIGRTFSTTTLVILLALAFPYTFFQKKSLDKIVALKDFEEQVSHYERFYKRRMLFHLFSCIVACALGVLTDRNVFFYFTVIDVGLSLSHYPSTQMFRRELKNDDIDLV